MTATTATARRTRRRVITSPSSSGLRHDRVEREPDQLLQLRAPRVRLVERARERRALGGEERLRVEHVVARRPADAELLAADAEILLGLADTETRRFRGGEALLGRALGRAHGGLELAQRTLERDPVP